MQTKNGVFFISSLLLFWGVLDFGGESRFQNCPFYKNERRCRWRIPVWLCIWEFGVTKVKVTFVSLNLSFIILNLSFVMPNLSFGQMVV